MVYSLLIAALAVLSPVAVLAVGSPDGFAAGTTGGGDATPVRPSNIEELKNYLCDSYSGGYCVDNTPRVIELVGTFDFRGSEGTTTTVGCYTNDCSGSERAIDSLGYCDGRVSTTFTYDNAGPSPRLVVGSNKSLIGVGNNAIIQGTGLLLQGGVSNIIIQNINLVDINSGIVWGGDGITMRGCSNVWIDHNYFARIGRQMIVTGYDTASYITISDNVFDGRNTYSAYCDGSHYWLWLFLGGDDTITLARNYILNTSGRGPSVGGADSSRVTLHMVNNYFLDLTAMGAVSAVGRKAFVLMEGNYFQNSVHPVYYSSGNLGGVFFPLAGITDSSVWSCSDYVGRACEVNNLYNTASTFNPVDDWILIYYKYHSGKIVAPYAVNNVPSRVVNEAGVGKVN